MRIPYLLPVLAVGLLITALMMSACGGGTKRSQAHLAAAPVVLGVPEAPPANVEQGMVQGLEAATPAEAESPPVRMTPLKSDRAMFATAPANGIKEKTLEARVSGMPVPVGAHWAPPQVDPRPIGDRDLGKGKDNEKLGNPPQRIEPEPEDWRDMPYDPWSGERYPTTTDHPFVSVATPGGDASTFGLDVDTASWSTLRRYLTNGRMPPAGAIRTEELINAFTYGYPAPEVGSDQPLRVTASVAVCPWAESHRLVRVAVKGKVLDRASRPPLNLVYLVDTSGSMRGENRLPLVVKGLEQLIPQLDERDHLAIVTYAGSSTTPLPAVRGNEHDRIREALRALRSGGSTNGAGGILAAYAEAAKHQAAGTQSRVILCTDGDFNVGVTGDEDLTHLIERQRTTGIFLTVYGFGTGNTRDSMMQQLANHGNGTYGLINDEADVKRLLVGGAVGQLVTIAKDAKVQVFFNPAQVAGWRQIGYEKRALRREDFNNDAKDAGDVGAGHTVTVLYEVVPAGLPVPAAAGVDPSPYQRAVPLVAGGEDLLQIRLRWKAPDQDQSRLAEQPLAATVTPMDRDFQTAAALAALSMQVRQSPWKGTSTWDLVESLAKAGAGDDAQRRELVSLIAAARGLSR